MTKIVLDEISDFRPGWDERAIKKLYYKLVSDQVNKGYDNKNKNNKANFPFQDRAAMRRMYDHAVRRVELEPRMCRDASEARKDRLESIYGKRVPDYVSYKSLPGAEEPPDRSPISQGGTIAQEIKVFNNSQRY